eukprot:CAMPEP_0198716290 /NCGR_PEP_ID=MMETSP1471-20131121/37272_1 /TAXON_ID=41880 /ORGANISM="Pycnococcus provasolii, Strain RCC733" /LENGTH=37 /DNA_ID= /DNA_START= /DNA_END= /DNA_ORIENTATION=
MMRSGSWFARFPMPAPPGPMPRLGAWYGPGVAPPYIA